MMKKPMMKPKEMKKEMKRHEPKSYKEGMDKSRCMPTGPMMPNMGKK